MGLRKRVTMFTTLRAGGGILLDGVKLTRKGHQLHKLPSPQREIESLPIAKAVMKRFLDRVGARVIYHGLENIPEDTNVFFASNHVSDFDPFLVYVVMDRPTGFIAKIELSKLPMASLWMENIGCIFLDRGNLRSAADIVHQAAKQLEMGMNMLIYPEGTRSRGGEPHLFKRGSFKPAFEAKKPIVPVYIDSAAADLFENSGKLGFAPAEVHVYFGEPVETKDMTREEQKAFAERGGEWILSQKDLVK